MYLYFSLSLGDPHHEPYREDPEGSTERIKAALLIINHLAPNAPKWYFEFDEDVTLVVEDSKVEINSDFQFINIDPHPDFWDLKYEALKRLLERKGLKKLVDDNKNERILIGRYGFCVSVYKERDYDKEITNARNIDEIISALDKKGWIT